MVDGWVGGWVVVVATAAGTGREEGSETSGREVSRDGEGERRVGENGLQHGGCSRERGCGRTDLLPGSHVPPARETGRGGGARQRDRDGADGGRERRRAVEGGARRRRRR